MLRTLLVNMPFMSAGRPNLALTNLKGVLLQAGYQCEVVYANLAYAEQIGINLYGKISEKYPQELLLGDLIFSPFLNDTEADDYAAAAGLGTDQRHCRGDTKGLAKRKLPRVPDEFWDLLPHLRSLAAMFLEQTVARIVHDGQYDVVGLSLTFNVTPSLALARLLKSMPEPPSIVVGGSSCDEEAGEVLHAALPWIDFVCRGEGEQVVVDVIRYLDGQDVRLQDVPGLVWRSGERTMANGRRAPNLPVLDDLPMPDYEDWWKQTAASALRLRPEELTLPFESSRGCWYGEKVHCTFCGLVGPNLVFRSKTPQRVIDEIRHLERYGVRRADAVDLILDFRFFDDVLPGLAALEHSLSIFYEVKANLTREQLRLMKAAGLDSFQPGIESLSSATLRLMKKGCLAFHNVRLLKWAAEFEMGIHWNVLYGIPGEEPHEYQRMADLVPLISHLPAPTTGCTPVVLSRYSPLFYDRDALGVCNVRPVPAYHVVYRDFPEVIEHVAYFFDHEAVDGHDPAEYIEPLRKAIDAWQSFTPRPRFEYVDTGDGLELEDDRPIAGIPNARLDPQERSVFLACDGGADFNRVVCTTDMPRLRVESILEEFVRDHWVVQLDGRYLSLAVARSPAARESRSPSVAQETIAARPADTPPNASARPNR